MKALTLIQPWASCIAWYGKDVENRTWRPPDDLIGQDIAIHAGAKWDVDEEEMIADEYRVTIRPEHRVRSCIVAVATVLDVVRLSPSDWFAGPYGWLLTDVRPVRTPVPCRGAQGLWTVPRDVERTIKDRLA